MGSGEFINNYSPVGDLTVISVCMVMLALLFFSYVRKNRSFNIFLSIVTLLILAALVDVGYHLQLHALDPGRYALTAGLRCLFHVLLMGVFWLFIDYIVVTVHMDRRDKLPFLLVASAILLSVLCVDLVDGIRGQALRYTADGTAYEPHNSFLPGYVAFVMVALILLYRFRDRLYKRVMNSFYATIGLSFLIMAQQYHHGQSSFTVATFLYPVIAMFYVLHSTPYDATLGAIDGKALQDVVRRARERRRSFIFMSLYLPAFDEEGKLMPEALKATIRRFAANSFRGSVLFDVGRGHDVLLIPLRRNPDWEARVERIMDGFYEEYAHFRYDYKIVIGRSIEEISRKNEYISFIRSVHRHMEMNSTHRVTQDDVKRFNRAEFVLSQLEDIARRGDLEDPRVLAYCQPVLNLKTRQYDTAETLMRMELDEVGRVMPDEFIPLAEENGYIHALTRIILNKTCRAVRGLLDAGYAIGRVSVNVSALELDDEGFCEDITRIIEQGGVPGDKIAIELTESRSDNDFMLMKDKIGQLRKRGIKFYLDDFGTGYSNIERIMELPFDIIKFDRSLVIASGASERSRKLVYNLANMFAEMNYSVLYEGVETESDEEMCRGMSASYLQGYKYSRPVPIEALREYFRRQGREDSRTA